MSSQSTKRAFLGALVTAVVLVATTTFAGVSALGSSAVSAPAVSQAEAALTPWAYLPLVYDPPAGTWSLGASMRTARYHHTSTLLSSGKVLVAGGMGTDGYDLVYLTSAELYSPTSNSWSSAQSMSTARQDHTATLLPSGKVLVAGGCNGSCSQGNEILAGAELYDPGRNSWSRAGSMRSARFRHTATRLPSGKVLVTGGFGFMYDIMEILNSAELYDPATNSWSPAGTMSLARTDHTATLLRSGKVLVAGGRSKSFEHSSAELYDPASNNWSSANSMHTPRVGSTAILLPSGKVLVAGGYYGESNFLASAELYDPGSNSWSLAASMSTPRGNNHTATLLPSGKVLAAGGFSSNVLASTELYNP